MLAQAWLRAARRFRDAQTALVDDALSTRAQDAGVKAALAAADAPAEFVSHHPNSGRLLLTLPRADLVDIDLPGETLSAIEELEGQLIDLMIRLAVRLWDRKDAEAVDTITECIVDLPTAILLSRNRLNSKTARAHLRAAVHAVLDVGPPPRNRRQP
ncbi:hypothetical protein Mkiyose1665_40650 [Mycobacterium kiyosense]|uniref:TetR family transcriptional regulator n=1 Tax=Mycobacterium kiyosense TaxID=2871094 RepID=A0A9P3Q643_9MYCO|nr:hypothetical protein IWGMT90018_06590 [Mycobacterium kiyosense]BDE12040.1 hypothetical protein MKCMC460_09000 [Mycobacterium sp. 20KCMC460]GLB86423.1 hypothetical protein SRL2020028_56790 [Mycobacterium kiyosense]GLB88806.1 hypothetical protein SRL2020130_16230 [Mycobacterium kiyosense]GLB96335.1 hypothetical protein SRL2020226_31110 [Mycobacterium kiyosense]